MTRLTAQHRAETEPDRERAVQAVRAVLVVADHAVHRVGAVAVRHLRPEVADGALQQPETLLARQKWAAVTALQSADRGLLTSHYRYTGHRRSYGDSVH